MTGAHGPIPRNRLGSMTFVAAVFGAVLACNPATVAFGGLLCLAVIVPAIIAVWRCHKGIADNRRRSVAALVSAPVFLVVALLLTPPLPVPDSTTAVASQVEPLTAEPPTTAGQALADPAGDTPSLRDSASAFATPSSTRSAARALVSPQTRAAAPTSASAHKSTRTSTPTRSRNRVAAPEPTRAASPASERDSNSSSACNESTHYVNSSGNCVRRPSKASEAPSGATAKCADGTYSSSQHRQGTCSRHGGVATWL